MDRSSSNLLNSGGKPTVGGRTLLHTSARGPIFLFTRSAPPHLSKSRTRLAGVRNGKAAPPSESSLADLSFGVGIVAIGGRTRRKGPDHILHEPARVAHATGTCHVPHVALLCHHVIHHGRSASTSAIVANTPEPNQTSLTIGLVRIGAP